MKKYVSSEFVATKYGIYKAEQDIITSFPSIIIANGGNVTPWAIYGNEISGDYVGDITSNICPPIRSANGWVVGYRFAYNGQYTSTNTNGEWLSPKIPITDGTDITISAMSIENPSMSIYFWNDDTYISTLSDDNYSGSTFTAPEGTTKIDFAIRAGADKRNESQIISSGFWVMVNIGDTSIPFEPYGMYKIPLSCGTNNYNIYMADVLRKSSGLDPVYDIMSSSGTITRNVDTDGTPLVTPTTESFTPPTIATAAGNNSINFGTTVKPSKFELTYTGWHMYDDKKYSGGEWS